MIAKAFFIIVTIVGLLVWQAWRRRPWAKPVKIIGLPRRMRRKLQQNKSYLVEEKGTVLVVTRKKP